MANSKNILYTINVNPFGDDLITGADTLTLTDVMDSRMTLDPATFKVVNSRTGKVPAKLSTSVTTMEDGKTKLEITIPDSTPISITYQAIPPNVPAGKDNKKIVKNLTNTASLNGMENFAKVCDGDWEIQDASAGTSGEGFASLTVHKADDKSIDTSLSGAEFQLYSVNMDSDALKNGSGNPSQSDIDKASTKVQAKTTDKNGNATFGGENAKVQLSFHTLYYVKEIKAPEGYVLDASPHYVMLRNNSKENDTGYDAAYTRAKALGITLGSNPQINVYDTKSPVTPASVQLTASKTFTNGTLQGNDFSFKLFASDKNGKVADGAEPLQTKQNDQKGNIKFDKIDLTDGTYYYVIREVNDHKTGVTYDNNDVLVTVAVSQKESGALSSTISYKKNDSSTVNSASFVNTYLLNGSAAVAGTKKVMGNDGKDYTGDFKDKFTFTLTGNDGAPIRVSGDNKSLNVKDKLTASNAEDGSINFGELHYTQDDLKDVEAKDGVRSKTFTYTVSESGSADNVTNDAESSKTFTVTLKDDGNGTLNVTTNPETGSLFTFTNTYKKSTESTGGSGTTGSGSGTTNQGTNSGSNGSGSAGENGGSNGDNSNHQTSGGNNGGNTESGNQNNQSNNSGSENTDTENKDDNSKPARPNQTTKPGQQPTQPGTPGTPGQSVKPGDVNKPGTSDKPGESGGSGTTDNSGSSNNSGATDKPTTPSQPGQSNQSGQSGQTGQSGQSGQSTQSSQSTQSGQAGTATTTGRASSAGTDGATGASASKRHGTLSRTGAAVSLIAVLAVLMLGGGVTMLAMRRRADGVASTSTHGRHSH